MSYADLLAALQTLTPEQLQQPVQCILPTGDEDEVQTCLRALSVATVAQYGFYKCRSTHNNRYCPDDVVILLDDNIAAEDGQIATQYDTVEESLSGAAYVGRPIYINGEKTKPEEQCSPEAIAAMRDQVSGDV